LALAKAVDAEAHAIMQANPVHLAQANNYGRSLVAVEAACRGVGSIDAEHSLMNLKISFTYPTSFDWLMPTVPFALQVMANMPVPPGPSPEWWKDGPLAPRTPRANPEGWRISTEIGRPKRKRVTMKKRIVHVVSVRNRSSLFPADDIKPGGPLGGDRSNNTQRLRLW
jgi:hypothetical protein